ncbi:four helix bundle protein [Patescibacteria group bacterium]|nr:four helix bundle protein [Patescibacteria group bacterium]MBU4512477.1 four helix bundle protein [Patescibacteria group bacterium]MCG2692606.1 four helix bundle protein [Candidatus Parcubacteria bacterium]
MTEIQSSKQYDLEERTGKFAKRCREFEKQLPRTAANIEDGRQLIKSSGSVAANYIEANEALSRKDFFYRIKICRKEAKESRLWLRLVDTSNNQNIETERRALIQEATELMKIFGSIIEKEKKEKQENLSKK